MYRKCATEISARHQKQITDALLRLMQKADYESITVTELCQAAGVSRRVFYHLFANKTGALYALVDQKILNLQSYSRNPSAELVDFFRYWKEEKPFLDALDFRPDLWKQMLYHREKWISPSMQAVLRLLTEHWL